MFKIEGCGAGDDKQGRTMFKTVGCGRGDDKQGDGVLNLFFAHNCQSMDYDGKKLSQRSTSFQFQNKT